ncbi:hypothetical protein [Gracilibacillus kekensis]|nr:hypothetical protein [Gracilibacillus kekensis]
MSNNTKPMTGNLARKLLNDKNVYLTEEGKRLLKNMSHKHK